MEITANSANGSADTGNNRSVSFIDKVIGFEPTKKICTIVFCVFILLSAVISYFHEPWLDEAQSWMIGRDASYYDMIFVLPHYEGHPPVWSLLLSIPAKLGMPYELSLGIVMLIISSITAYLIIFRSPFCGAVRLILPFTYFFFYQYGMIARPYGLLTLGLMLAAMFYKDRNKNPFRFAAALALVCGASAFGILLSGGIAAAWCVEIIAEYKLKGIFTEFIKTRRFAALLMLLCIALFLVAGIVSYDDTFNNDTLPFSLGRILAGIWYMLFMLPADCLIIGTGYGLDNVVKYETFTADEVIILSILGMLIIFLIADICRQRGKLLTFIIPYTLLAVFGSAVYFMNHHVGVAAVFYVFILWICFGDDTAVGKPLLASLKNNPLNTKKIGTLAAAAVIAMQLVWCVNSVVMDIGYDYYYGRAVAEYLKEHELDGLNIMSPWFYEHDKYDFYIISADKQHEAATVDPYFDENIFFNFNYGDKSKGYILHRLSEEANEEQYELWSHTVPDILVGEPMFEYVYKDGSVKRTDYILVKTFEFRRTFKLNYHSTYICVYMRKDLFGEHPDIQPENPLDLEFIE